MSLLIKSIEMNDLGDTIGVILIVLFVMFLFFIFTGSLNIWIVAQQHIIELLSK